MEKVIFCGIGFEGNELGVFAKKLYKKAELSEQLGWLPTGEQGELELQVMTNVLDLDEVSDILQVFYRELGAEGEGSFKQTQKDVNIDLEYMVEREIENPIKEQKLFDFNTYEGLGYKVFWLKN